MNVIVFGGAGFIGSHLADELTSSGHKVKIFDIRKSRYQQKNQEMIVGDILDAEVVQKAISGCEIVYNLAGIADLNEAASKPVETFKLNVLGNLNVMEACVKEKVKRFVYASTIYVYSDLGGFYRCSKQAAETYIEEYNRKYGLDFTILRFGTVYGPRADARNSVYRQIRDALKDGKIVCNSTGDEVREYIHVKDLAKLSVKILSDEFKNERVVLTGHHSIKFKEMLNTIKEILGNKVEIEFKGVHANHDTPHHYFTTPHSYTPTFARKLVSNHYVDLGQGLLDCIHEISKEIENDKAGDS